MGRLNPIYTMYTTKYCCCFMTHPAVSELKHFGECVYRVWWMDSVGIGQALYTRAWGDKIEYTH